MNTWEGFSNYPTWLVKNWLDADGQTRAAWIQQLKKDPAATPMDSTTRERLVSTIADGMRAHIENNAPQSMDIYTGLLNYAIGLVNWREIAAALTLTAD